MQVGKCEMDEMDGFSQAALATLTLEKETLMILPNSLMPLN
jgi:hypothetical protein